MKTLLPLFLLLFCTGVLRAQQKVVVKDSSVTIENDTDTFPGTPSYNTYNDKCLLAEQSSGTSRSLFSYYPDDKPYQTLTQVYNADSGRYINSFRGTDYYNAAGKLSFVYDELWNSSKGVFEPYDRDSMFYNTQMLEARSHVQTYDTTTQSWVDFLTFDLYYNSQQQLDSTLFYVVPGDVLVKDYYIHYEGDNNYQRTTYNYVSGTLTGVTRITNYRDSANYVRRDSAVSEYLQADGTFAIQSTDVVTAYFDADGYLTEDDFGVRYASGGSFLIKSYPFYASCPSALPVALLRFSAAGKGNDAVLNWKTANETNTTSYTIQKSTDGIHFTTIGNVPAQGSGAGYIYTDRDALRAASVPKLYYRITENDKGGSIRYSPIASLDIAAGKVLITASPNPATNVLKVYSSVALNNAIITVSDMRGRVVYSAAQNIAAGSSVPVDVSAFAKGIYIVTVQSASYKQQVKIVKE